MLEKERNKCFPSSRCPRLSTNLVQPGARAVFTPTADSSLLLPLPSFSAETPEPSSLGNRRAVHGSSGVVLSLGTQPRGQESGLCGPRGCSMGRHVWKGEGGAFPALVPLLCPALRAAHLSPTRNRPPVADWCCFCCSLGTVPVTMELFQTSFSPSPRSWPIF